MRNGCPQYLNQEYGQDTRANGIHKTHVVTEKGLAAATAMQVQFLDVVLVVVVGRIVKDTLLDAGPWGGWVTTAEWNTIHQVAAIHIAPHATTSRKTKKSMFRINTVPTQPVTACLLLTQINPNISQI